MSAFLPAPETPLFESTMTGCVRSMRYVRPQREEHRGRVAAGVCDEARFLQLAVAELRQSVHGLGEQLRTRVIEAVPRRVQRRLAEADRAGEVDDLHPRIEKVRHDLGRHFVRRREEDDLGICVDELLNREGLAREAGDDVDVLVAAEELHELLSGIARGARDSDASETRIVLSVFHGRGSENLRRRAYARVRRRGL